MELINLKLQAKHFCYNNNSNSFLLLTLRMWVCCLVCPVQTDTCPSQPNMPVPHDILYQEGRLTGSQQALIGVMVLLVRLVRGLLVRGQFRRHAEALWRISPLVVVRATQCQGSAVGFLQGKMNPMVSSYGTWQCYPVAITL